MQIEVLYGKGRLAADLPQGVKATVIEKPEMPVLRDPQSAVANALDSPLKSKSLAALANGAQSACILICDVTRPVPNGLFLRAIVERLVIAGIELPRIRILVATGLHRPNLGQELAEVVGDSWISDNVQISNHYARRDEDHVHVGVTSKGTIVRLDRRFVEADIRIATGLVEPHFMAGYSGGRKVVAPGVAHAETITTFHNHRFMSNRKADNCVLEGNPLHEEQLEIMAMLGETYAVNTVIDDRRQLSFINFGEIVTTHLDAVTYVRQFAEVPCTRRFKTVVTSAAGYPLDKTYYQTVKGMVGALGILSDEGDLIIASECSEGLGSAEYRMAQKRLVGQGGERFLRELAQKSHAEIDEWQSQMQLKPLGRGRVTLVSTLSAADRDLTGVDSSDSLEAAIRQSVERQGDEHIAVVPEGPYVIPVYQRSVF